MKFINKIIFAGAALILGISCKKTELMNPIPKTSISDVSAFDQPYRVANQVLSLYSDLKAGGIYGGRVIVYGDIRGEDFLSEDPNLVTNADVWNYNPTNSANAVVGLWSASYRAINDCNLFIDGMAAKGTAVVGEAISKNYLAEARLIRALCYYNLVQYYARPFADANGSKLGVPLRLTGIKGPGLSDKARSTVAEVYDQIISDLDFAESNLPNNYSNAYNNTTRAHKNTAIALKTRVYLSMGSYPKVVSEANKLVPASAPFVATSGVANKLVSDYSLIFKTPYTTDESIFSMPFTTGSGDVPGTQNGLQGYFFVSANGVGSIFSLNPAGIVGDPGWTATDARRSLVFTSTSAGNLGKKYIKKYTVASPADYTPVIRWAEVLLNFAEAKARATSSVDAQAVALLNAVRQRSDVTTSFTAVSFANSDALVAAILNERRIEFLGEGLRNIDLMRQLLPLPAKASVAAVAPSQSAYTWPVSDLEKSLNKLWVD